MEIKKNILLAPYTTFKIGGPAKYFCVVKNPEEAKDAFKFAFDKHLKTFILAKGSNVLISDKGFNGLVIKIENKGVEILKEDDREVLLKIASGEIWDNVVKFAVEKQWWGIENLSHIPGSAGAIAVQNVGAYGQEASNVIQSVIALNAHTEQIEELNNQQCDFAYRKSAFNSDCKGKYIIFYIILKLSKIPKPELYYRDLKAKFAGRNPDIEEIRQAVIEIRDKKYPFPTEARLGNAGSFFKNPSFTIDAYQSILSNIQQSFGKEALEKVEQRKFMDNNKVKIPAALLMELCALKDLKEGGASVNYNQPLVIVNSSGLATAEDVLNLAKKIIKKIYINTGIKLLIEPELVGFSKIEIDDII